MSEQINLFLKTAVGHVWGMPLVILSVGGGIFLTLRIKGVQFRGFLHAINVVRGKYDNPDDEGDINHFQALCTALSATIGLGNIAGVAIAIQIGGPGALFWMWVVALFGMATKFTTCTLAVRYRTIHEDGSVSGGPMYFIRHGLGKKWAPMATMFALFCAVSSFGGGNMFQSNQVAAGYEEYFGIHPGVMGAILAFLVFLVIIGGIRRIGNVAARLVPLMCIIYIVGSLVVIIYNFREIPAVLGLIFRDAFTGRAVEGGTLGMVIQTGVRRAVFSNEAGLGSAAIAHAAAKTKEPVREGLVAMLGPFIDTIVICSMTAFVIIFSEAWKSPEAADLEGVKLTIFAFDQEIPGFGKYAVNLGVLLFAFSTMISWSYYGERCAEYIFGERAIMPYKWLYVAAILAGSLWNLQAIINLTDILFAFMIIPNLSAALLLSGRVFEFTRDYFVRMVSFRASEAADAETKPGA